VKDVSIREVAESLGTTPEFLLFIPELLADIWVLGSSPKQIIDLLHPLALPPESTRLLELGCGKGAVAITLAKEAGFRVFGIDRFLPFVREAKKQAKELGVANLCGFACSDMRDTILRATDFNVVVYAAVGDVLGSFDQCVRSLRQCVHPGGYIIIDDGFLAGNKMIERPGYGHYVPHEETLRQLTAHGDILLREIIVPVEDMRTYNRENTELIRKRAKKLAEVHPEAAESLSLYVRQQEMESEILETKVTEAIWLLQRTE